MPEVIKTVGPGKDYESQSLFEAGEQRTLGVDEIAVAECDAFIDTTPVLYAGWDGLQSGVGVFNIIVRPAAGNEHNGVWDTGYRLICDTADHALRSDTIGTYFADWMFENTRLGEKGMLFLTPAANCECDRMLGRVNGNAASRRVFEASLSGYSEFRSCLADGRNTTGTGFVVSNSTSKTINCGVFDCLSGFADQTRVNCWAVNCPSGGFFGSVRPGDTNNASDDATAIGANPVTGLSLVDGVDFVSPSTKDYRPVPGGKLDAAGSNTELPMLDIAGNAFADPPSIGAYEIAGGPPPGEELAGTLAGTSTLIGALAGAAILAGTLAGTSTLTGTLGGGALLSGTVAGTSTLSGDLYTPPDELTGTLAGTSTMTGTFAIVGEELAGGMDGTSTLTGALTLGGDQLAGTLGGTSTLTGDLDAITTGLSGALIGTSTLSGDLTIESVAHFEGTAAGSATLTGTLATSVSLQGTLDGLGYIRGTLVSDIPPRIPATLDLTPFFNLNELAHDALLNQSTPFQVIITEWYADITGGTVGLAGTDPVMIARHDDIPGVREGDSVSIAGYDYTVREVMPDNTGVVRLKCEVS